MTWRRVLRTMPSRSQAESRRLTVCSVVPVISAMSARVTGKAISIPSAVLRPDWFTIRSSAAATRCSTAWVASSVTRLWNSPSRAPSVR